MKQEPDLIQITSPSFIEVGDEPAWEALRCDGCGQGWDSPSDKATFWRNPANDATYLLHQGMPECITLLVEKIQNHPDLPSIWDRS